MFRKLLKHELKAQAGLFGILSAAALVAGLIGGLMMSIFANTFMYDVIPGASESASAFGAVIAMMVMMAMVFAIIAYAYAIWILLFYRFYKRHFSDEGYLTFTLPATTHEILLSSIANIAIWSLAVFAVVGLSVLMLMLPIFNMVEKLSGETFGTVFSMAFSELGTGYFITQLLSVIGTGIGSLMLPPIAITLGALAVRKYKLLAGFGIYFGINMILSTIVGMLSAMLSMGIFMVDSSAFAASSLATVEMITMGIPAFLYFIIGIGGYFLMHYLVEKRLNL